MKPTAATIRECERNLSMSTLALEVGDRDHTQGRADAPITLVEYGDYQCPHCGRAYPIIKAVQRHLGAALRFVYRNFPLGELHPHAEAAAEAAEAAGAQGKFWQMHDILFENQSALGSAALAGYAERLSVDMERWTQDMELRLYRQRVQDDILSGVRSDVQGTPTFFINGHRHDAAFDERTLLAALEDALHARRA
jgi:protein-disulfide isomerase